MVKSLRSLFISLSAILLILAGCGDDEASVVDSSLVDSSLTVVVTTNILGDVVERLVGDQLVVETIMPVGADPHLFQASAKQVNQMMSASVVVANGADFEEGLIDILSTIEGDGVAIFEAMSSVQALEFGSDDDDHDDHDDDKDHADHDDHDDHDDDKDHADHDDHDDHDDDKDHADHDDHAGHDHSGLDPHFFTDPIQMIEVVEGLVGFLTANIDGLDSGLLRSNAASYVAELQKLHVEVGALLGEVPSDKRVLVTNHEVFSYFAKQYGFEVVATVIPSTSTLDSASAKGLAELVKVIESYDIPAIFADVASSDVLAETLAQEVGDIKVVNLYSEGLGAEGSDAATYLDMIRTNSRLISEALTSLD